MHLTAANMRSPPLRFLLACRGNPSLPTNRLPPHGMVNLPVSNSRTGGFATHSNAKTHIICSKVSKERSPTSNTPAPATQPTTEVAGSPWAALPCHCLMRVPSLILFCRIMLALSFGERPVDHPPPKLLKFASPGDPLDTSAFPFCPDPRVTSLFF